MEDPAPARRSTGRRVLAYNVRARRQATMVAPGDALPGSWFDSNHPGQIIGATLTAKRVWTPSRCAHNTNVSP